MNYIAVFIQLHVCMCLICNDTLNCTFSALLTRRHTFKKHIIVHGFTVHLKKTYHCMASLHLIMFPHLKHTDKFIGSAVRTTKS